MNRKTAMTDSIGTVTYTYDAIGNLIVEDGPFANDTLYYDYTPDRQLAAITSSFYNVEYAYDTLGRLSTVIGAEGTNTYTYTAAGTLWTKLTLANGTTAERQFDALLRLTNLVNRADAGVLSSFALTLDDADQRTQVIREDGKVYTYGYDAIGQLTNASAALPDGTPWSGYQFSYAYDATGNPVEQNKNGLVYSNSFNNLNQNAETHFAGGLAALGTYSSPLTATVTVNNVQAQLHDGDWAATGILHYYPVGGSAAASAVLLPDADADAEFIQYISNLGWNSSFTVGGGNATDPVIRFPSNASKPENNTVALESDAFAGTVTLHANNTPNSNAAGGLATDGATVHLSGTVTEFTVNLDGDLVAGTASVPGFLVLDGTAVQLDPAPPAGATFYRIRVALP